MFVYLLDYNQFSRILIWTIASIEVLLGLYNLCQTSKTAQGRIVTYYVWLIAVETVCFGILHEFKYVINGLLPLLVLAALIPITSLSSVIVLTILFQPHWLNFDHIQVKFDQITHPRTRNLVLWFWIFLICLPFILSLVDLVFKSRLYITVPSVNQLTFSIENYYDFTSGVLSPFIRIFTGFPTFFVLLVVLIYSRIKSDSLGKPSNAIWFWLAFCGVLVKSIIDFVTFTFSAPISLITIGNFLVLIVIVLINLQMFAYSEGGNGKLIYKIWTINFITTIPLFIFIYILFVENNSQPSKEGNVLLLIIYIIFFYILSLILFTRTIKPLQNLSQRMSKSTGEIIENNFNFRTGDEISLLADAIIRNALEYSKTLKNYEIQAEDQIQRINHQKFIFDTAAKVTSIATSTREMKQMLHEITILIADKYSFYHIGIYLLDDVGEFAILQASNSEEGQRLISRGYKLLVGQNGIVSYVAGTGRTKIAQDVKSDYIYVKEEELSLTKSELAFPLKTFGNVIGVLDIHSKDISGFNSDDIHSMNLIANQIALAVENGRRLQEIQRINDELRHLSGQQTIQSWRRRINDRKLAYRYNRIAVEDVEDVLGIRNVVLEPGYQLEIPLSLRGISLGSLILRRDKNQSPWTDGDLSLAVSAVDQIIPALENARLLEEIEQSAVAEHLISQISARIQGTLDLESVMRNTVEEIYRILKAGSIRFSLDKKPILGMDHKESNESKLIPDHSNNIILGEKSIDQKKVNDTGDSNVSI